MGKLKRKKPCWSVRTKKKKFKQTNNITDTTGRPLLNVNGSKYMSIGNIIKEFKV